MHKLVTQAGRQAKAIREGAIARFALRILALFASSEE